MDQRVLATRLRRLQGFVESLRVLLPVSRDAYLADDRLQGFVERRLQLSIQACMDIASYLVGQLRLSAPDNAGNIFQVLAREGVIERELGAWMAGMVRFRNILVHDYLDVDSDRVYEHFANELDDFDKFARQIIGRFLTDAPRPGDLYPTEQS